MTAKDHWNGVDIVKLRKYYNINFDDVRCTMNNDDKQEVKNVVAHFRRIDRRKGGVLDCQELILSSSSSNFTFGFSSFVLLRFHIHCLRLLPFHHLLMIVKDHRNDVDIAKT